LLRRHRVRLEAGAVVAYQHVHRGAVAWISLDLQETRAVARVGVDHDVVAGLGDGGADVREKVGVELVCVSETRERLAYDGHVVRLCRKPDLERRHSGAAAPRAASIAASRPLCTGSTGTSPVMSSTRRTGSESPVPSATANPTPRSSALRRASSSTRRTDES